MTDQNTNNTDAAAEESSSSLFNTAAGWVLFAAGLGLGLSILSSKYFHGSDPERPEQLGYVIEVAEEAGGAPAEMTFPEALSLVSVEDGERVYAKCQACHTIAQGGANGVGPNLHGIMGSNKGAKDFAYSSGLASMGGQWGWEEMNAWLKKPSSYIEGTKMSFAGLSKIEDRAAVALYMNSQGSGIPVPEYTPPAPEAEDEVAADGEAAAEGEAEAGA